MLLIELKSSRSLNSPCQMQTLTYFRLLNLPLGLLINFGGATYKQGIKRIMNDAVQNNLHFLPFYFIFFV